MEGSLKVAEETASDQAISRTCKVCGKTFSNVSNKRKHMKNMHGLLDLATATDKSSGVTCEHCGKIFSRVSNKKEHIRVHHEFGKTNRKTAVTCRKCDGTFGSLHTYRDHLRQVHNVIVNCVHHQFESKEEFVAWKDEVEMNIGVSYTAHSGSRTFHDGSRKIYYCRRSGVKKTTGDSRNKRAEKSQGTSKMGFYCTSSIEALVCEDGRVLVTYYVDHHDHGLDFPSLVHMRLPNSEKDKIAGMILEVISHDKILDQMRESAGTSRAALLEMKDNENNVSHFWLYQEHMLHPEDSTSVRLFMMEFQESGQAVGPDDIPNEFYENGGGGFDSYNDNLLMNLFIRHDTVAGMS